MLAEPAAARGVGLALLDLLPHLFFGLGLHEAEHLEELAELAARLVGPLDDLLGDRGALGGVRLEELRAGLVFEDRGQLPGEVVGESRPSAANTSCLCR
jgi:hypothetical protein